MKVESCIPVIPSANLEKSLLFWVGALGLKMDREIWREGKMVGCMVHNGQTVYLWLNQRAGTTVKPENYEGIRLYLAPSHLQETWKKLKQLGFSVSDIVEREYGQVEFFVKDDDGFSHCFGVDAKAFHKLTTAGIEG